MEIIQFTLSCPISGSLNNSEQLLICSVEPPKIRNPTCFQIISKFRLLKRSPESSKTSPNRLRKEGQEWRDTCWGDQGTPDQGLVSLAIVFLTPSARCPCSLYLLRGAVFLQNAKHSPVCEVVLLPCAFCQSKADKHKVRHNCHAFAAHLDALSLPFSTSVQRQVCGRFE